MIEWVHRCRGGPPSERRSPALAAIRRHYPGFVAAFLIVLLRTAIGWHFLYEGLEKVYSTPEGRSTTLSRILPPPPQPPPMEKAEGPFSAEGYLRNATGPLAPYFRGLVPDVESRSKLELDRLKASWTGQLGQYAGHYQFTPGEREAATADLHSKESEADIWFRDPENAQKVGKYFHDLELLRRVERTPNALESDKNEANQIRPKLEPQRRELVQVIDAMTDDLHKAWLAHLPAEKVSQRGGVPAPPSQLDLINLTTKIGMTAVGACLLLGFLTRLSALGAAAFLAMFYLSMPPWPGLPVGPMSEGHYLFVNKNLIEFLACLLLAATPSGQWVGLDALLFGWLSRWRAAGGSRQAPPLFDNDTPHGSAEARKTGSFTRSDR